MRSVDTPWLQMYPDIGNLAATGKDVPSELRAGGCHIVGVHEKDTRTGEFRRVPLGEGCVDFEAAFRALKEIDFNGPLTVEMWNEAAPDPAAVITEARRWLGKKMEGIGSLPVILSVTTTISAAIAIYALLRLHVVGS